MNRKEIINASREKVQNEIRNKKVLFIATKELDYIRNSQEISLLKDISSELKIIGSNKKSYPSRLLKVYMELFKVKSREYDIIFIGFAPQLVLPIWNIKFKDKEIIIDFFISMYDTFVNDRKRFKEGSLVSKFLKFLDRMTLSRADKIICDTNAHGTFFCEELGAENNKLMTLYMKADTSIYYPRIVNRPTKLEGKFIVLYFGSILPLQGVDVVLEAYNMLREDDRFYFYMIGPLNNKYTKPESENIEYISWLPQEELAEYIAMADLCLAGHFNGDIDKAKRTIPGKAYIFDAMDKRIVLGDNLANRELFSENDIHIYFSEMSNARALKDTIITAFEKSTQS